MPSPVPLSWRWPSWRRLLQEQQSLPAQLPSSHAVNAAQMAATAHALIAMRWSQWATSSWAIRTAAFEGSVLLRGGLLGHPQVAGHAADALASTSQFTLLRGVEGFGHTAADGSRGSSAGRRSPVDELHVAAGA